MCGIAGIHDPSARRDSLRDTVARMNQSIAHRGPDDDGVYVADAGTIALGNRRLSIIDLSVSGHQPLCNEDETLWIAYNGEIYNYEPLREELLARGHRFRSHSDTEVIVHLYEEYGAACLDHLRGMFAFAIWDARIKRLFLARDRFGIKPLYYWHSGDQLVFASEVRALVASGSVPRETNPEALTRFLQTGSVPAPLTTLKNVFALPAGYYAVFENGALSLHQYWDLDVLPNEETNAPAVIARVRELLEESVRLHLVSDVPVGVFLSGGIDSSALVALASQQGNARLKTLSIAFEEAAYDESRYARLVAEKYGTEHVEYRVAARNFLESLPRIFAAMDQPTVDGVNTYFVAQAAQAAGLKVVLTGLGGDEIFWGYDHFREVARWNTPLRALEQMPAPARVATIALALAGVRALNQPRLAKAVYLRERGGAYWLIRGLFTPREIRALLPQSGEYVAWDDGPRTNGRGFSPDRLAYLETKFFLQNQLLKDTDFMSMAHSIEARVPFLDHALVEYVAQVPAALKLNSHMPKPLLVRALGDLLPREIVYRPKQGFTFPFAKWIKHNSRELRELTTARELNASAADEVWSRFLSGRAHWSRVWALVVLSRWLESAP